MKEATKLLIESGVIPESVVNMCRIWGGDDAGLPTPIRQQQTQEELLAVVKRVADILDSDSLPEIKETEPGLQVAYARSCSRLRIEFETDRGHAAEASIIIGFSSLGKALVRVADCGQGLIALPKLLKVGNVIRRDEGDSLKITGVEPRYEGDALTFYVCDVEATDA